MEYPDVNDNSVRAEAIAWWIDMEDVEQELIYKTYYPHRPFNPDPTASAVEGIYRREFKIPQDLE